MKPNRIRQVGELLQRELAQMISSSAELLFGCLVTVSGVKVSKDLKYADVAVSILGADEAKIKVLRKLKQNTKRLRYQLAGRVALRRIPELRFALDESLEYASKIDRLLDESGISFGESTEPVEDGEDGE